MAWSCCDRALLVRRLGADGRPRTLAIVVLSDRPRSVRAELRPPRAERDGYLVIAQHISASPLDAPQAFLRDAASTVAVRDIALASDTKCLIVEVGPADRDARMLPSPQSFRSGVQHLAPCGSISTGGPHERQVWSRIRPLLEDSHALPRFGDLEQAVARLISDRDSGSCPRLLGPLSILMRRLRDDGAHDAVHSA